MARTALVLFLVFMVMFVCFIPSLEGRKLILSTEQKKIPSLKDSLFLSALPKGTTPASGPSKKIHAMALNEQHFTMHLATIERILRSVPSPGVGH